MEYAFNKLTKKDVEKLRVGDIVYLNGKIYTARDEAHLKIIEMIKNNEKLPFDLNEAIIYHAGPIMKKVNDCWTCISIGPTTSARMNDIEEEFIKLTNISKVINDMNVDILALQEIETKEALKLLLKKLPKYKYYKFLKNPNASIGVAIISKYPIINTKTIKIDSFDNYNRPILEATIKIKNKTIKILHKI